MSETIVRYFFWTLFGLALVGYALTGVTQIRPGERAVVRRFGRVLDEKPTSGLYIGLPWGMETIDRVAVDRVQSLTVGFDPRVPLEEEADIPTGQLLTGDHNLVNVRVVINYRVDPDRIVEYVLHEDKVPGLLSRSVEASLNEWVAGRTVDDVLLNGKRILPDALVSMTQEHIRSYNLGVEVLDARITLIAPPDEVKRAFDDVTRAQTGIETQRLRAEQDRSVRVESARADVESTTKAAEAYAFRQEALAEGNARVFTLRLQQLLAALETNPNYLRQIWVEERSKLLKRLQETGQLGLLDDMLDAESKSTP